MMKTRRWLSTIGRVGARASLCAIAAMAAGCSPLTAVPPWHFAETAEVLDDGAVSITAAGGAGGLGLDGSGAGGTARVRVGTGNHTEVGIEGNAIRVDNGGTADAQRPWLGGSWSYGAKLSFKNAPRPWFAIIGGVGGSRSATGLGAGVDVAGVFSTARALGGWFRPYGGLRLGFAMPVDHDLLDAGGVTGELVLAGGAQLVVHRSVSFFLEAGGAYLVSHGYQTTTADPDRSLETYTHGGAYGLAGISLRFPD